MEVQVECANITDEERKKILDRAAIIAGMMVREIREKMEVDKNGVSEEITNKSDINCSSR